MSDNKVHIRDLMVASKSALKDTGTVPNVTMCGQQDPNMNKLAFGDYRAILKGKVKNPCERCINKWKEEESATSGYKKTYNEFRKLIFKAMRMGHMRGQK